MPWHNGTMASPSLYIVNALCIVTDAAHPLLMTKHMTMLQFLDGQ